MRWVSFYPWWYSDSSYFAHSVRILWYWTIYLSLCSVFSLLFSCHDLILSFPCPIWIGNSLLLFVWADAVGLFCSLIIRNNETVFIQNDTLWSALQGTSVATEKLWPIRPEMTHSASLRENLQILGLLQKKRCFRPPAECVPWPFLLGFWRSQRWLIILLLLFCFLQRVRWKWVPLKGIFVMRKRDYRKSPQPGALEKQEIWTKKKKEWMGISNQKNAKKLRRVSSKRIERNAEGARISEVSVEYRWFQMGNG